MSHKESRSFFRRIRSPLERSTAKHEDKDKHRSSSTSAPPAVQQQQSNGHNRSGSDDVLRIENTAYGDPDILNSTPAPGTVPRSHSSSTSPGDILNPPLPPRNPPKPSSNMNDESPVYVAPADTLQRGNNAISQAVLSSNYSRTEPMSGPPSKNERKVMEMHQLTMVQKQRQEQGQSAQQQQRVQPVIDNSEYSTPFNLLQQQQKASRQRNSIGGASSRQRRVPQVGLAEDGDQIIPVLSPPPDRSQTTSPSSPLSTPSSEHEEGGGGSGVSAGGGDSDYDIPWDKKFKDLPNFNRTPRRQLSGGKLHNVQEENRGDHPPPPPLSKVRKDSPPYGKMYNRGHPERDSPPAPPIPPDRNPPIGGPVVYQNKGKRTSPQPPEDTLLGGRPRYLPSRHQSEQVRPRDGSTSPNQLAGRSYGHTIHGPHIPRDLPPEISPRTSSMSIPPHMSGRRLPSPPRERSESSPVEPGRRGMLVRPPSPPNPVHIDFSIPLCDQP